MACEHVKVGEEEDGSGSTIIIKNQHLPEKLPTEEESSVVPTDFMLILENKKPGNFKIKSQVCSLFRHQIALLVEKFL